MRYKSISAARMTRGKPVPGYGYWPHEQRKPLRTRRRSTPAPRLRKERRRRFPSPAPPCATSSTKAAARARPGSAAAPYSRSRTSKPLSIATAGHVIAGRPSVGVSGDGCGNGRSGGTIPIIDPTRRGLRGTGQSAIPSIGGTTGWRTPITRSATVSSSGSGIAAGAARLHRPMRQCRPILQRWPRQRRFPLCREGFTGFCRRRARILQRWPRGWSKSLSFQRGVGLRVKTGRSCKERTP